MKNIKPLPFLPSLPYFGLPALMFVFGFWVLMPWFISRGMLPYYAYLLGINIPLAILLALSFLWLRREGREVTWATIQERFRLKRLNGKAWLWSLGALFIGSFGYGLVSQVSKILIVQNIIFVPASIPQFVSPITMTDPKFALNAAMGNLHGNWLPFVAMIITLVLNILGEEFWWRGVVLPRQELAFGQWAWAVHGVLWAFFHVFKWWDVLNLLPITLSLSFVCSRLKNTTPGIVIHFVINGLILVPLLKGILG